ncbi:uncharacterized protein AKAW2_70362S [Aspergillus luchuensis]|uniref:Uncharacterized protein n=1 Tax=Aspergillus kawachii TaxID=1069201 RepID=A0A7R7WIC7_ASPKA|nr:uncharacterized protein AKAW2_70362S [Aspergillus luchuensis]BCS03484.1 hypothetical protein AKAW2_70362S [Aspergillus luchuensis]
MIQQSLRLSFSSTLITTWHGRLGSKGSTGKTSIDFNFHIFEPDVPESHELYDVKILVLHHLWFGPFPVSYKNICDQETQASIVRIMSVSNRE